MTSKIAFRRGFFRGWMVLSAMWLALIGVANYQQIAGNLQRLNPPEWQSDALANGEPAATLEKIMAALRSADKAGDTAAARKFAAAYRDIEAGTMPSVDAKQIRLDVLKYAATRELVSGVGFVAALAIFPPLILLALGLALAWVLAGFRRT